MVSDKFSGSRSMSVRNSDLMTLPCGIITISSVYAYMRGNSCVFMTTDKLDFFVRFFRRVDITARITSTYREILPDIHGYFCENVVYPDIW